MSFKCGIIGLPNAGKSTIFNALTVAGAAVANYPFCTIEPNIGIVPVPDTRLQHIAEVLKPASVTHATMTFVDIAGLVKGANNGEGLGNRFLGNIRDVDAIIHVVRCFEDSNVSHVRGIIDPTDDVAVINTELILADLETIEKKIEKSEKLKKTGNKSYLQEIEVLERVKDHLGKGFPVRNLQIDSQEQELLSEVSLLTGKKMIYVANISEDTPRQKGGYLNVLEEIGENEKVPVVDICGKLESELMALTEEDRDSFLKDYGMKESGLIKLIHAGYELLNLISFYTTDSNDLRAWTVLRGTRAPEAAGRIHTDMERGFIRAEILHYDQFMSISNMLEAKEKGIIRIEGRDYIISEGDIVHFRFNV